MLLELFRFYLETISKLIVNLYTWEVAPDVTFLEFTIVVFLFSLIVRLLLFDLNNEFSIQQSLYKKQRIQQIKNNKLAQQKEEQLNNEEVI